MVIRMRHTRSHTKNRRSHHALKAVPLSVCSNCGAHHRPHHMCLDCGFYNGRQVMDLSTEKAKREARMQAKREMIKGEGSIPQPEKNEVSEPVAEDTTKTETKAKKTTKKKLAKKVE